MYDKQIRQQNNIPSLFLCPRHDNGRGIKCYPCPYVRTLHSYVRTSVQRRPLS